MKTILTALMSLYATAAMADECLTFTDGDRIYDFEFHDNVNVYQEQCKVECNEGICTFDCADLYTTVILSTKPIAIEMPSGKITLLEPLCQ